MRRTTTFLLSSALAATTLAALPPHAGGAAGTPNLVVSKVTVPAQTTVGREATFRVTVRNTTGARAGASKVKLFLSNDGRHTRGDVALGTVRVRGIGPGDARTVRATFTMPAETGPRRVVACADSAKAVKETNERDNCRVTKAEVFIWPKPRPYVEGEPDPRNVTPTLGAATTTKEVGPEGGQLTLTAGGDKFTLVVPPNALLSPVDIAMRPLTSVDGLGMSGGLLAGVDLAPDGLTFLRPATLTIIPDRSVALDRQAGFAYQGDGTDLHAYGLENGDAIVMKLTHFTGAGVGSASDADRTAQQARVPASSEAQWEQQFADLRTKLREAHEAQSDGTDPETAADKSHEALAQAAALAVAYLRDVAVPGLRRALSGDTTRTGAPAIRKFLAAARQLELLGVTEDVSTVLADGWAVINQIFDKLIPDAHRRCIAENDPSMALLMLATERQRQLMGIGENPLTYPAMSKCLRFELDFEYEMYGSAWTDDDGDSGTAWKYHVRALKVPVGIDAGDLGGPVTGSGPSEYVEYSGETTAAWHYSDDGEPRTCYGYGRPAGTRDGTFHVRDLDLDLNYYSDDPEYAAPFRLEMKIDPGQIGEDYAAADITRYTASIPSCPVPQGTVTNWWWAFWYFIAHNDEVGDPNGSFYTVRNWTPGPLNSGLVGTKLYNRDVPGGGDNNGHPHELTSLVLRHTPAS